MFWFAGGMFEQVRPSNWTHRPGPPHTSTDVAFVHSMRRLATLGELGAHTNGITGWTSAKPPLFPP